MREPTESKPIFASRTIRVATIYIVSGGLIGILHLFDLLGLILENVNLSDLPPDKAAWFGFIVLIIGMVQARLRTITTQPIGDVSPLPETEGREPKAE